MNRNISGMVSAGNRSRSRSCRQMLGLVTALQGSLFLAACGGASADTTTSAAPTAVTVVPAVTTPSPSASPTSSPTPTSTAPLSTTPAFSLGVNVASMQYYSGEPAFANLLTGDSWRSGATTNAAGGVILASGRQDWRVLTPPAATLAGKGGRIRCTWEGTGSARIDGQRSGGDLRIDHGWEFDWVGPVKPGDLVWLQLEASDPSDPIRNLDCREKSVPRDQVFASEFLESLKPFGVLRFMDWSAVNANVADVTWAKRTLATSLDQAMTPYGVALEHQIALANKVDADPWFNIPWNADEDYVRRMAQMVHDNIPANRHVYAELSNEVWNFAFPAARQAQEEGQREGLATDGYKAALLRYAEKTRWAMGIWAEVFADRPGQLVRVGATQSDNPWTAQVELDEGKMAPAIDAIAIAPYFGADLFAPNELQGVTDTGVLMSALAAKARAVMTGHVAQNAAIARAYGKRLIAYEAGQHVIDGNVALVGALNRSDAMYDIYRRYLADWKRQVDDTIVLFNSSGAISNYGAWGLREYAGQPLTETPKRRAAIAMGRSPTPVRSPSAP